MRNSSSLDWLRFMHTPNDYRVSLKNTFVINPVEGKIEYMSSLQDTLQFVRENNKWLVRKDIPQQNGKQSHD